MESEQTAPQPMMPQLNKPAPNFDAKTTAGAEETLGL